MGKTAYLILTGSYNLQVMNCGVLWYRVVVQRSFPSFRRFGWSILETKVKSRRPLILNANLYPALKTISKRMDSNSDLGLETMFDFDKGLHCCVNPQQKDDLSTEHEVEKREELSCELKEETVSLGNDITATEVQDLEKDFPSDTKKAKSKHVEYERKEDEPMQLEGQNTEVQQRKKNVKRKKKNAENKNGEDDSKDNTKPPKKRSPNYFIAIRVSNPSIHSTFKIIQDSIITKQPLLQPALIPLGTLHITLMVMHLQNDQLSKAIEVLHNCQSDLKKVVEDQHCMTFEGLGHFRNEVVFGKIKNENEVTILQQLAEVLRNGYEKSELDVDIDDKPFKPHLTLMKMSRIPFKKKTKKLRKIPDNLYSPWIDCDLDVQHYNEVLLCSMTDAKEKDGFYHSIGSVAIAELGDVEN